MNELVLNILWLLTAVRMATRELVLIVRDLTLISFPIILLGLLIAAALILLLASLKIAGLKANNDE